jgi:hypothetical protein
MIGLWQIWQLRKEYHIGYTAFQRFGGIRVQPIKETRHPLYNRLSKREESARLERPVSSPLCATPSSHSHTIQAPFKFVIQQLCSWSCGLAASEVFRDTEEEETDSNDEDNAEDHDDASFLAGPVTLGELMDGIAHLERLRIRDGCHFEIFMIKRQQ